jgi:hypothetical protein
MLRRVIPFLAVAFLFVGCKKKQEEPAPAPQAAPTAPAAPEPAAPGGEGTNAAGAAAAAGEGERDRAATPAPEEGPATGTGAQGTTPAAPAPEPIAAGGASAASAVASLPPGATMFMQIGVKEALASEALAPVKPLVLENMPPPCREMVESLEVVLLAGYSQDPEGFILLGRKKHEAGEGEEAPEQEAFDPKMVAVLTGAKTEIVKACVSAQAEAEGDTVTLRTENRGGREVMIGSEDGEQMLAFALDETTHVIVVGPSMVDAALATAGGGESLAGSDILKSLEHVPAGPVLLAFAVQDWMGEGIQEALAEVVPGAQAPLPTGSSISLGFRGADLLVVSALATADETAGAAWEDLGTKAVAAVQSMMANPEDPGMKMMAELLGPVVQGITLERRGNVLLGQAKIPFGLIVTLLMEGGKKTEAAGGEATTEPPAAE